MSLIDSIAADVLQPDFGQLVTLFEMDLTDLGGSVTRFSSSGNVDETTPIAFDLDTYYPRAVEAKGFAVSGSGKQPRPTIRVSNLDGTMSSLCRSYMNCIGGKLTRRRTLKKYLDGEPGADATAEFPPDVWEISKKMAEDKFEITWELHPYIDREGRKIPGRVVLRDTCAAVYRYYDGGFQYPTPVNAVPCPYTGSSYFKRDGSSTATASEDDCGHRLSDCKLRFGNYDDLPYLAFPGVGLVRRS